MKLRHYLFTGEAGRKAGEGFGLIHKALGGPKYREIRKARLEGRFYCLPENAEYDRACVDTPFEECEIKDLLGRGRLYLADAKQADLMREAMEHMENMTDCRYIFRNDPEGFSKVVASHKEWGKRLRAARAAYLDSWKEITDPAQIPEIQEPKFILATWEECGFGSFAEQATVLEFVWVEGSYSRDCGPGCPYDCDTCKPEQIRQRRPR